MWSCDRPAAAVHAALCPESAPLIAARLPSIAAAHVVRCAQAYAAVRRCSGAGPRGTCGDVRGVCPILVPVNHLHKEHPA
ncbi:hypothetical protein [Bradyrhizobium ivorense]|uniref:hypothetical protein n=1 Tax=Bradyrhizobium ivorense TaxID=2511166 RepID=UPI00111794F9|nr:hypothetical protein [Bradyrhizobium ivorense]